MKISSIEFLVNDNTLRGKIFTAEPPKNLAMLFLHGWTGRPNEPAGEFLAKNGYTCMTFSLSGHNNSDGLLKDQTREKSLQEIVAAYDFFASKLPTGTKICVAGNSYGGYMSSLLSAERPLGAIQMRAPANNPDERFNERQLGQGGANPKTMAWREQPRTYQENRALNALHNFSGPVQIIEAENDSRIPRQTIQNYINAISKKDQIEYHFMKGWPHSMGSDPKRNSDYQRVTLAWLEKIS